MAWRMKWFLVKHMVPVDVLTHFSYFLCSSVTQLGEREDAVFDFLLHTIKSLNPEHVAEITGTRQYKYYQY